MSNDLISGLRSIRASYSKNRYQIWDYLDALIGLGKHDLLIAPVSRIRDIVRAVDRFLPPGAFYSKKRKTPRERLYARVNKLIEDLFNYKNFLKRVGEEGSRWGGKALVLELAKKVRYCPYCNAESVTSFEFQDGNHLKVAKTALDHFFPVARYPFLSLSLYNLIPACHRCNSRFKLDKSDDLLEMYHPYERREDGSMDFHEGMKFELIFRRNPRHGGCETADFAGIIIRERHRGAYPRGVRYKKMFKLEDVYTQLYLQNAVDVYWKAARFPAAYFESIRKRLRTAGVCDGSIERLIYGTPLNDKDVNYYRFAKLTVDLARTYCGRHVCGAIR